MMRIYSKLFLIMLIFALVFSTACNDKQETSKENSKQTEEGSGQVYEGDMVGEWAHGHGVLYEDGEILYEGDFVDGYIEGYGKYYEDSLLRYEGEFSNGNPLGQGTFYNEGRLMFEGDVLENEGGIMLLQGVLYDEEENPFFRGELSIDGDQIIFPDYGELLLPDGEVYYEGDLIDGMPASLSVTE